MGIHRAALVCVDRSPHTTKQLPLPRPACSTTAPSSPPPAADLRHLSPATASRLTPVRPTSHSKHLARESHHRSCIGPATSQASTLRRCCNTHGDGGVPWSLGGRRRRGSLRLLQETRAPGTGRGTWSEAGRSPYAGYRQTDIHTHTRNQRDVPPVPPTPTELVLRHATGADRGVIHGTHTQSRHPQTDTRYTHHYTPVPSHEPQRPSTPRGLTPPTSTAPGADFPGVDDCSVGAPLPDLSMSAWAARAALAAAAAWREARPPREPAGTAPRGQETCHSKTSTERGRHYSWEGEQVCLKKCGELSTVTD